MEVSFQESVPVCVALDAERFAADFLQPFAQAVPGAPFRARLAAAAESGLLLPDAVYRRDPPPRAAVAEVLIKAAILECGVSLWLGDDTEQLALLADEGGLDELDDAPRAVAEGLLGLVGLAIGGDAAATVDDPPWSGLGEALGWSRFQAFSSPARVAELADRLAATDAAQVVAEGLCAREERELEPDNPILRLAAFVADAAAKGCWVFGWEWIS